MQGQLTLGRFTVDYGFSSVAKATFQPCVKQVHGTDFFWVKSAEKPSSLKEADAVLTQLPDTKIYVSTADCLPILLAGESKEGVTLAAIHSGWRGTMKGVVPSVLKEWPAALENTHAILGPALGPCCFEVKQDFIEEFKNHDSRVETYLEKREERVYFNMPKYVIETQLTFLRKVNIHLQFSQCTYCTVPPLPSFRRNKGTNPQIKAWLSLRGTK